VHYALHICTLPQPLVSQAVRVWIRDDVGLQVWGMFDERVEHTVLSAYYSSTTNIGGSAHGLTEAGGYGTVLSSSRVKCRRMLTVNRWHRLCLMLVPALLISSRENAI
jgi:hypothetical protein